MKKLYIIILVVVLNNSFLVAQDTLYVHQRNGIVTKTLLPKTDSLKLKLGIISYVEKEEEISKQSFAKWNGDPKIPYEEYNSSYSISQIWNKKWGALVGSDCYSTRSGGNSTPSISFDLNSKANNITGMGWIIPTRMKIYARTGYGYSTIGKNIRIWGSTSPNVSTTNSSGPDAWVLLSPADGFMLAPPSGQSGLAPTQADKKYIEEDGYELIFNSNAPPIRYIRLETVSKWDVAANINSYTYAEITLWGKQKKQQDTLCIVQKASETIKIPISNIDSIKFEGPLSPNLIYDVDWNAYHTIKIGTQTWMVENLKTSRYRNGDAIANITDNTTWAALNTGAWCYYSNITNINEKYGYLYNWYAINDIRKIAPVGWHVPNDNDWTTLTEYLGGENLAGGKLKEAGTLDWQSPNSGATNESWFSALPCGTRSSNGTFNGLGSTGIWWSSSDGGSSGPWYRSMNSTDSNVLRNNDTKLNGFSVRCIRNETPTLTTIAASNIRGTTATFGGNITFDGGEIVTDRGVCWSTSPNPTINNSKTSDGSGSGIYSSSVTMPIGLTKYYVRAYATNIVGTSYGTELCFTTADNSVYDIDGNVYHYITIGSQTWMVENLKTTRYRNGDAIANITDETAWAALTTGAWCNYSNSSANGAKYGHIYNWYAATDVRNIAPLGWHIPTDADWTTLTTYLGGTSIAGYKLKEAGTLNWNSPNTGATNETGFSALPGGFRNYIGAFSLLGDAGYWWGSSELSATNAWYRGMYYDSGNVNKPNLIKANGFSLRCIMD
jgi:uncharacterized protein (TIGR02145 family)